MGLDTKNTVNSKSEPKAAAVAAAATTSSPNGTPDNTNKTYTNQKENAGENEIQGKKIMNFLKWQLPQSCRHSICTICILRLLIEFTQMTNKGAQLFDKQANISVCHCVLCAPNQFICPIILPFFYLLLQLSNGAFPRQKRNGYRNLNYSFPFFFSLQFISFFVVEWECRYYLVAII